MKYYILALFLGLSTLACQASRKKQAPAQTPSRPTAPAAAKPAEIPVSNSASNVAWLNSERLMPVLEVAQSEKKPVFVEFYASWCAPCKVMEEEIFTQTEVFRYLNIHFLNFRTDFDSPAGRTIADIYEVSKLPTVLFLNPQGVVLERHVGIANPSVLNELGNSALQKMGQ
jgi:thiol:disulfide interchange protein